MATMTMLAFERDGAEVMLTESDAIIRAVALGDIQADTDVTLYFSDRSSTHKKAADHTELAAYFAPEPEPVMQSQPFPEPPQSYTLAERLRVLEADLDGSAAGWENPGPRVDSVPPAPQTYQLPQPTKPRGKGRKSRFIAAFLAAFLGVFGAHKFYLGKPRMGWLTLAVFGIGITAFTPLAQLVWLLVLLEAVIYIFQSDAIFQAMAERRE